MQTIAPNGEQFLLFSPIIRVTQIIL